MPDPRKLLMLMSPLSLGAVSAAWSVKTVDVTRGGAACDPSREQYIKVQVHDYHDHPKFNVTWRQVSGLCGSKISDAKSWTAVYDEQAGDLSPVGGKVQLNLLLCAPYGDYELVLSTESYSDAGSTLEQRTSWEIVDGHSEYPIWDTVRSDLASDGRYSPRLTGTYTWPLPGTVGFYRALRAGPVPPIRCQGAFPGTLEYVGCFSDHGGLVQLVDFMEVADKGEKGMTIQGCSEFCAGSEYFGVELGYRCLCGLDPVFFEAGGGPCSRTYQTLCTGDPGEICGGLDSVDVYRRMVVADHRLEM